MADILLVQKGGQVSFECRKKKQGKKKKKK